MPQRLHEPVFSFSLPTRRSNAILPAGRPDRSEVARPVVRASPTCPLPSAFMTQTCHLLTKATFRPSGDQDRVAVSHSVARQSPLPAPVGVHDVDLQVAVTPTDERDPPPVGRPCGSAPTLAR